MALAGRVPTTLATPWPHIARGVRITPAFRETQVSPRHGTHSINMKNLETMNDVLPETSRRISTSNVSATSPQYEPLSRDRRAIRLVEILPPTAEEQTVRCRHIVTSLEDKPSYVALSYVWGDATDTTDIVLNDKITPVTKGSASALQHIWCSMYPLTSTHSSTTGHSENPSHILSTFPSKLWIDAMCINQDDLAERSSQVELMGDIYSRANKVIVWLGLHAARLQSFSWMHETFYPALYAYCTEHGIPRMPYSILDPALLELLGLQITYEDYLLRLYEFATFYNARRWFSLLTKEVPR